MEAFQALLGDDFCFFPSSHIVARTPRKRPIMTSDHADKMEITVVFQCPPLGKAGMGLADGWCAPLATPSELLLLTGRCLHVPLPLLPLTGCCLYVPLALLLLAGRCLHVPLPLLLLTGCSSHVLCALLLLAACSSHLLCALLLLAGLTLSPLPLSIHR